MREYIKPSIEIAVVETTDIITASSVIDNGQATHKDESGNIFTGQKGTFTSPFEGIW